MKTIKHHQMTYYYTAIDKFYKGKIANRSGVPYINHIDEGLLILDALKAPTLACEAYCLHPLFQGDVELKLHYNNIELHSLMGTKIMQYVMEYRNVANACLAPQGWSDGTDPKLSPIEIVNWMLLADKIQNYKDFRLHQRPARRDRTDHTMSRSQFDILDKYFQNWLALLAPYFGFTFDKEIEHVWNLIHNEEDKHEFSIKY